MAKKAGKRGAPEKSCPKCGTVCHARRKDCTECGYVFPSKVKIAPSLFPPESEPAPARAPSLAAPKSASANDFRFVLETERQKLLAKLAAIEKLLDE